jgi:glycerate 2-kinase
MNSTADNPREPEYRALLRAMFDAAIAAQPSPAGTLARFLPPPPKGRTIVVGAGKAAASMAAAVEAAWRSPLEGLVVTRYGHGAPTQRIEVVEAAHPVPDAAGAAAARAHLERVKGLGADDLVLCLISGGGIGAARRRRRRASRSPTSRRSTARCSRSGAGIAEMNCVRKHLSAIKGGRLAAAAAPARVVGLLISDVPGDDPATSPRGRRYADPTTSTPTRWRSSVATRSTRRRASSRHLEDTASAKRRSPAIRASRASNVASSPRRKWRWRRRPSAARAAGVTPLHLGDAIEGEARERRQGVRRRYPRSRRRARRTVRRPPACCCPAAKRP